MSMDEGTEFLKILVERQEISLALEKIFKWNSKKRDLRRKKSAKE